MLTNLEVTFINFTNPDDITAVGRRCDSIQSQDPNDMCDILFDICIGPLDSLKK